MEFVTFIKGSRQGRKKSIFTQKVRKFTKFPEILEIPQKYVKSRPRRILPWPSANFPVARDHFGEGFFHSTPRKSERATENTFCKNISARKIEFNLKLNKFHRCATLHETLCFPRSNWWFPGPNHPKCTFSLQDHFFAPKSHLSEKSLLASKSGISAPKWLFREMDLKKDQ